ncbi:MAG TPA: BF3164 family lipoprotein [Longimicrobium sp.]|jgi:hypothetical protein|uniref:BF3164 family lipoprotein n=1 Tax=Longimicrobium sp. TaxID=2029185 RepID=UPI002ED97BBE
MATGCTAPDRDRGPDARQAGSGVNRISEAPAASDARRFSGRVPRLAGPPRDTLRQVRSFGDTSAFAIPTAVHRVGDLLVVTDRFMNPHISVFSATTGEVVRRAGRHGKGPGEFQDPSWLVRDAGPSDLLWAYDFSNRRFSLLEPGKDDMVTREVPLDAGVSLATPVWNASGVISNGLFPDYTLVRLDSAGRIRSRLASDPPFTTKHIANATGRRLLNRSFMTVNPSRTRLALSYQWKSRVDFFTIEGERIGSVAGPRHTTATFRVAGDRFFWGRDDENEMAYWQMDSTERYVYALFCGCKPGLGNLPSMLHVYDWNGNFVAEFAFDRQVTSLDVSDDDRVVYATMESPYPGVGEWRLPAQNPSASTATAPFVNGRVGAVARQ